jgi:hypothetical protein
MSEGASDARFFDDDAPTHSGGGNVAGPTEFDATDSSTPVGSGGRGEDGFIGRTRKNNELTKKS